VTKILGQQLNITAMAESQYWFTLDVEREMIYNPKRPVGGSMQLMPFQYAKDSIQTLYD